MGFGPSERRWARIIRPDPRPEVDEELAFHLEQRVRDYEARGLHPDAARAAARRRLGDLVPVREECTELLTAERRKETRRDWMKMSWLDFKLGFRMLLRYPGLTLVGGLAIAFAIWVGAGTFELMSQAVRPSLPFAGGERVVGIRNWNVELGRSSGRVLHDFALWREELKTVDDVGAFRTLERNLTTPEGATEPAEVAEISASAFRVTGARPLMGRTLQEADEQPSAPLVAVIGQRVWEDRFASDPAVVGKTVRLGGVHATVVGVMPEEFEFPVKHSMWTPLRLNPLDYERGTGPTVQVFGKLADGATLKEAQAELTAVGAAVAAEFPETSGRLRPQVMHYPQMILDIGTMELLGLATINLFVVLLLVLICANVALLMFARAATRESEIVVRNALGASRGRIIAQLFAEALVLGALAAVVGLSMAGVGLGWLLNILSLEVTTLPYWIEGKLSPVTIAYTALLTLLVAVIAGVMPALKVTKGLQQRLRDAAVGARVQFGGIWTVVIVAQVAVTVVFPVVTFFTQRDAAYVRDLDLGFPEEQYLSVQLEMDREPAPGENADSARAAFNTRFHSAARALQQRLAAQPAVAGVTVAERLPRMYHPHRLIGVDAGGAEPLHPEWPGYRVSSAAVDIDYFDVLQTPIVAGRGFNAGDVEANERVVIVNQTLVNNIFGNRNPLGRRIRYERFEEVDGPQEADDQPWYEIVGVISDHGMKKGGDPKAGRIYHPLATAEVYPLNMAVHVKGDPMSFSRQLRALAVQVDPRLRLYGLLPFNQASAGELKFLSFWLRMSFLLSAVALLLSLAAIYAVMSFTVARRTREIGIRAALGADRFQIARDIFRRPILQVAAGVLLGGTFIALIFLSNSFLSPARLAWVFGYAVLMMAVCMLACIAPTRRALSIQPTEAMRADG